MKSIKEKALDIYPKMSKISESHGIIPACNKSYYLGDANEEKREGFIEGANYVLDEVECILEENKLSDCEEICNELIVLIEQLKK